jgi:cytochrome c-L
MSLHASNPGHSMKPLHAHSEHPWTLPVRAVSIALLCALGVSPLIAEDSASIQLRSAVDDAPIDMTALRATASTAAMRTFLASGRNEYVGNAEAALEGRARYEQWCQICHLADASGRMGPSLVDDVHNYARSPTDLGLFEIIYAGAAGAMQPFDERLTGDEILKVIAYVRSLAR